MRSLVVSLVAFFVLFVNAASAKPTFNVEITVKDDYTGKPIPNAEVIIVQTNDTLLTDETGSVFLHEISEQSLRIYLSHDAYVYRTKFENFKKRQRSDEHLVYHMYPRKALLDQYLQPVIDAEMAELRKIDSTQYLPCDQDSTPIQVNTHFPGGTKMFQLYISSSIQYPEESIDMGEQGKVYTSFVIEKDGTISNIKVDRGISILLDREAKRLIREMPNWIPSYCNGRPQRTQLRIPLIFVLN